MGRSEWVVVLDFDGTLIPKSYGSLYDVIDRNGGLTEECLRVAEEMRKFYFSKQTLTSKDERQWFVDTVKGYIESGLTLAKIERILARVALREGVVECLRSLKRSGVPVAIVSYQIVQFVETALRLNGADTLVEKIYATDLLVDERGRAIGFDPKTGVFPRNKGHFSRLFARSHRVKPERILAVGDSHVGDRCLGHLKRNRLGIAEDEKAAQKLRGCMGEVITTMSFDPVSQWLMERIRRH